MSHKLKFGPMNLSELIEAEGDEPTSYYGVKVDKFCADRIKSVARISFIAELDEPGEIGFDVIDTMIQYKQAKADVVLEVPFDFDVPAKNVLVLANSIGVSVLIAPPETKNAENWGIWSERVKEYAKDLFSVSSFSGEILPVTSYVQYMAMKVMGYTPKSLTDDPAMHHYFEDGMDTDVMDSLKEELSVIISEGMGGGDSFEQNVQSTLSALNESVLDIGNLYMENLREGMLSEDPAELEPFLRSVIKHIGHTGTSDTVLPIILDVIIEHKDPEEVEQHLLNSLAELSSEEIESVNDFIKFLKTVFSQ